MFKCDYCEEVFETKRKCGIHKRLCKNNPKYEERIEKLRKGGAITFKKIGAARALVRNTYNCVCKKCGADYQVTCTENDFNKESYKQFCSRKCSNSRVITDEIKSKISKTLSHKVIKNIKTVKTKIIKPKLVKPKSIKLVLIKYCTICNEQLSRNNKTGFCKNHSNKHRHLSNETLEKMRAGGLKSAANQMHSRRSKNEIAFYEKCKSHFKSVLNNVQMFNGWDADVIIEDLKIAVLWNGAWHYKKIKEKHSVEQVQNRDRIKIKNIQDCGYEAYIIKDMGKFSNKKVEEEFKLLLEHINNTITI